MGYLMGLDIGTRSIRSSIFDEMGKCVADASVNYNINYFVDMTNPEWAFVYPEELWNATVKAIRASLYHLQNPRSVVAVSVACIGMDGIPLDEAGKPLYPFISWQCTRTKSQCDRMVEHFGEEHIFNIAGRRAQCTDSIYRIIWFRENYPELFGKMKKWLLMQDYINYKLSGVMITDYSMASTTSLLDQKEHCWSREFLDYAQIDAGMMPDILPSGTTIGKVCPEAVASTGLSEDTVLVLGGHDYLCALLPYSVSNERSVFNIVDSWDMAIALSDSSSLIQSIFQGGLKLESHVTPGKYAIVGDAIST